jgi:hypothetical protein
MDFNTGSGGAGGSAPPPRGMGAAAGGPVREFDLSDPVASFVAAVRSVVLSPVVFFRSIVRGGDYVSPLVFAAICYGISAVLGGVVGMIVGNEGFGGFILGIISGIIGGAVGLFIGAGIYHLLVMLLVKPEHAGYEATFRVAAYASVTTMVSWIPFIGWILSLYGIYLSIIGIREMHSTTTGRAAAVVLIPAVIVFLIVIILLVLVGVALFFGSRA